MEGDAGASRLNPPPMSKMRRLRRREPKIRQESDATADEVSTEVTAEDSSESKVGAEASETAVERGPSRLRGQWLAGIAAALLLIAGAVGTGGYFALRYHQESQAIARNDAAALKAAMD